MVWTGRRRNSKATAWYSCGSPAPRLPAPPATGHVDTVGSPRRGGVARAFDGGTLTPTVCCVAASTASVPWSTTFDGAIASAFAFGLVAGHGVATGAAVLLRHQRGPLPRAAVLRSVLLSVFFLLVVARQGPTQVDPDAWQHLNALPSALWRSVAVLSPALVLTRAVVPNRRWIPGRSMRMSA